MRCSPIILTLLVGAGLLSACVEKRIINNSFPEFRAMADPMPRTREERAKERGEAFYRQPSYTLLDQPATPVWAILLETFTGKDAKRRALWQMRRLQQDAHLSDVWAREVDDAWNLYHGRYVDPNRDQAVNGLKQTRLVQFDGLRPYENVKVVKAINPAKRVF